jgi:hypothetical protein
MTVTNKLPKNFEITLNDLARAREKAAKQKYLLDLGESLVMHLCSFVLGEYKATEKTNIELEKSFVKNNKNVSFGIYLGWLREGSKYLLKEQIPSKINQQLNGSNEFNELSLFIKLFDQLKSTIDSGETNLDAFKFNIANQSLGKTNLLQFFDSFIQLRNRVAHPHKEVKGKSISWPFNEAYFDIINPYLENAIKRILSELDQVWEYRNFIVDDNDGKSLTLINDEFEQVEITFKSDFNEGNKVIKNYENQILISEWTELLKASEAALNKIKQEEEELRNKATIEHLKDSIKSALDDEQISLEELNFFESLGKTKLNLSKEEIKKLIWDVAIEMGIENPFPEIDRRYVKLIDDSLKSRSFNAFILKLAGQQYGVDQLKFDELVSERAFALEIDLTEIELNANVEFTKNEFIDFQNLIKAQNWLSSISLFNKINKDSQYKITGDSYQEGTKEFNHRMAFLNVETFTKNRVLALNNDQKDYWQINQNNWQIGTMTGYAWCSIFPKDSIFGKILSLHLSLYPSGDVATGFLPDWKDYSLISNYGLLKSLFRNHLIDFLEKYQTDLKKYPDLRLWDWDTSNSAYSFLESYELNPWFYQYVYNFESIHFYLRPAQINKNPLSIRDSFDISFNLFSGLFEEIQRDYQNLLGNTFLIESVEKLILAKLEECKQILILYGFTNIEAKGCVKDGEFILEIQEKVKGYPVLFKLLFAQDYLQDQLYFQIVIKCAGYHETEYHEKVERILSTMVNLKFEDSQVHFMRSLYFMNTKINDLQSFEPGIILSAFLDHFSNLCAQNYIEFLGLQIKDQTFSETCDQYTPLIDELSNYTASYLKNQVSKERNPMKGYRFIDYVYSNKKVTHWLGWGVIQKDSENYLGVIFNVNDTVKGAHFLESLEKIKNSNPIWQITNQVNSISDSVPFHWIFDEIDLKKFDSSSSWNRNYSARHAKIDNEKQFWCAKFKDDKQWISFEMDQPFEINKLKIQGAPHGKFYVKTFDLAYSVDKKSWTTLYNETGLKSGTDTKEISFETTIVAKYIKIIPIEFEGFPGIRIDFYGRPVQASQLELQALFKVNEIKDSDSIHQLLINCLNDLRNLEGLGF